MDRKFRVAFSTLRPLTTNTLISFTPSGSKDLPILNQCIMKKSCLFLCLFIGWMGPAWGQIQWGGHLGARASYLVEQQDGTSTMDQNDLLLGPVLGAQLALPLHSDRLYLHGAISLLSAGEAEEVGQGTTFDPARLWYANLPVQLGLRLNQAVEVSAGPWAAVLLSHNLPIDEVAPFDAGWQVGFRWWMTDQWGLELNYGQGLIDVFNARRLIFPGDPEELKIGARNRFFGLAVHYYWKQTTEPIENEGLLQDK